MVICQVWKATAQVIIEIFFDGIQKLGTSKLKAATENMMVKQLPLKEHYGCLVGRLVYPNRAQDFRRT